MSMAIIGAGVAAGAGIYSVYNTAHKNSQAKKLAASNKRPEYNADGSIKDVYNLTGSELDNTGLQDYATQQLGMNESNGIDAILKSGGKADFGVIHSTYGSQLQAALATMQKQRDQRIAAFNNASYNKAQSADAEFQYNQDAPFKDAKQREAQLRQQAEQAKSEAFTDFGTAVSNYGTATMKVGTGDNNSIAPEIPNRVSRADATTISSNQLRTNPYRIPEYAPVNNNFDYVNNNYSSEFK